MPATATLGPKSKAPGRRSRPVGGYWPFCVPAIAISALIIVVPAVLTIAASLTQWDGVSDPHWIGFKNYSDLFEDRDLWRAIFNNLRWMIIFLTVPMALGLIAASILLNRRKSAAAYQMILLVPYVLSPVANVGIWVNMIYDINSGVIGFLNRMGADISYPLGSIHTALYAVAATNIWSFWGYLAIVFYAAMRQTPEDQLEAALLEGASGWQIFANVTFPHILPTFALMFVFTIIFSFLNFDYIYLMTNGGPAGSSEMLSTLAYSFAFRTFEVGKAAAVAIAMSGFGLLASFVYVNLSKAELR